MEKSMNRSRAFLWVIIAYLLAGIAGIGVAYLYRDQTWAEPLYLAAIADLVGTLVIFIFSYIFRNSSFYDPYWSVAPIFIVIYFAWIGLETPGTDPLRIYLISALVLFWGVRLTFNWARGWQGLHHEDWRYVDLQKSSGKWYWLVSFSGIHLFPTILVFLGCLAMKPAMLVPGRGLNIIDLFAALFTLGAILIEAVSDEQLRAFVKSKKEPGATLTSGLWAYSRHPNYVGETSFWWGLFFFALAADLTAWWCIIGPLSMTLLFNFISIPMIDKRMLKRRENYAEVMERIPRFLPRPFKKG